MLRAALIQLNATDDPRANLQITLDYVREAAAAGAQFVLTPEVTNCVSLDRVWQNSVLQTEPNDLTLTALREEAAKLGLWILIGSLALKSIDRDRRFANRSFLIAPSGEIAARYDKIHMFDVEVSPTETYRESAGYRPGTRAVLAQTEFCNIGMTICYDLRFPALFRMLAKAGANVLTIPSAFSPTTGAAHWETLLRARAVETACFILAPAQTGTHSANAGKPRKTWGHSLAVSPWGEVIGDGGEAPGITLVDLDMKEVDAARQRIPSLSHDRNFESPQ